MTGNCLLWREKEPQPKGQTLPQEDQPRGVFSWVLGFLNVDSEPVSSE